jgi:hypothetical protein
MTYRVFRDKCSPKEVVCTSQRCPELNAMTDSVFSRGLVPIRLDMNCTGWYGLIYDRNM